MKIKNLRNKTLVFGNINVNPGEVKEVPNSEEVMSLLRNGYIEAYEVKMKEKVKSKGDLDG